MNEHSLAQCQISVLTLDDSTDVSTESSTIETSTSLTTEKPTLYNKIADEANVSKLFNTTDFIQVDDPSVYNNRQTFVKEATATPDTNQVLYNEETAKNVLPFSCEKPANEINFPINI